MGWEEKEQPSRWREPQCKGLKGGQSLVRCRDKPHGGLWFGRAREQGGDESRGCRAGRALSLGALWTVCEGVWNFSRNGLVRFRVLAGDTGEGHRLLPGGVGRFD